MANAKTIVLVSPSSAGHHQTYLRLFARTLLDLGYTVAAFTPEPANVLNWIAQERPERAAAWQAFDLRYPGNRRLPGPLSIWYDKTSWVAYIGRMIRASGLKPDLVFHTWLDNCLTPGLTASLTDWLFPYPWSGLYFHPWYLRRQLKYAALRRGPLSNHQALRSSRCPAVAILDEGVADRLQTALKTKPVIVFPDIADDAPPDRAFQPVCDIQARAGSRKIVALLGVLTRRKGVLLMLEAARQAAAHDWFFVLAGELLLDSFTPDEQQRLQHWVQSQPANCYFYLQRIPAEAQFNALVEISDVLFAVYQDFLSSSNLLTKAALFEKPVLVADGHCMGERVRRYHLGLTQTEDDVAQCVAALERLLDRSPDDEPRPAPDYAAYRRLHSIERLHSSFSAVLAAAGL